MSDGPMTGNFNMVRFPSFPDAILIIDIRGPWEKFYTGVLETAQTEARKPLFSGFNDDALFSTFTQVLVTGILKGLPTKNALVVAKGIEYQKHFQDEHLEVAPCPLRFTHVDFELWIFDSGKFKLNGPGGFRNWCFGGDYVYDQTNKSVIFKSRALKTVLPPSLPAPSHPTIPAPAPLDGVFLVNSEKNGKWTSGMAWFSNMASHATGSLPGAYTDIKKDGTVTWEGQVHSGKFPDGNTFTVAVNANAHDSSTPVGATVGKGRNNQRSFIVVKDHYHVSYQIDGWKVWVVYYCH